MVISNRYDFALLFDIKDGNPNGDPDAGNLPRIDPETGHGLITDVCLKRKLRNYVLLKKQAQAGYDIFVKERAILNILISEAHKQEEVRTKKKTAKTDAARDYMCKTYYDIRTFGAVMTTGENAGQVRGPVQITFSRSVDPVVTLEHTITRVAVATEADAEKQAGETRTMGRKSTIPYGLYVCHGFVSQAFAEQTGFSEEDLKLLWEGFINMFENDRSAARGLMTSRKLYVFKHESKLGNASASKLFDLIRVSRKQGVETPRSFSDYEVSVDKTNLPQGTTLIESL